MNNIERQETAPSREDLVSVDDCMKALTEGEFSKGGTEDIMMRIRDIASTTEDPTEIRNIFSTLSLLEESENWKEYKLKSRVASCLGMKGWIDEDFDSQIVDGVLHNKYTGNLVEEYVDKIKDLEDEIPTFRKILYGMWEIDRKRFFKLIDLVADYNTKVATIPSNIVASLFGFKAEEGLKMPGEGDYTTVSEKDTKTPEVKLN